MTSQGLLLSQCAPAKIILGSSFIRSGSGLKLVLEVLHFFGLDLRYFDSPFPLASQPDVVGSCLKVPTIRSLL